MPVSGNRAEPLYKLTYSSGLKVRAPAVQISADSNGDAWYLHAQGPTELSYGDQPIPGQGFEQHPEGFGSPIGLVVGSNRCLSVYSDNELAALGLKPGSQCYLEFVSGVMVTGYLEKMTRFGDRIVLLSFRDCRVEDAQGRLLFDPEWGVYDMAVGEGIEFSPPPAKEAWHKRGVKASP